jgi:cell fate (sporulation/competence/biofilm development) regulator YlbF (YheA/YmcA/DUF963 family)
MNAQLDVQEVMIVASELAELIKKSEQASQYLYFKNILEQDENAQILIRKFQQKKNVFLECERYGHFHPDYNRAFDEVIAVQDELDALDVMKHFKSAEQQLDALLFDVSKTIANSVSDDILVPSNFDNTSESHGCGDGGCSGKCS